MKVVNCTTNEFSCQSNDQCISSLAVCDGIDDCADKSDEFSRRCSGMLMEICFD